LDRDHIKNLEKSFVSPDKDIEKVVPGRGADMTIRHAEEYNGTLLVTISNPNFDNINPRAPMGAGPMIINAFDQNLRPKFEQVVPVAYGSVKILNEAYHADGDIYHILATTRYGVAYNQLDLNTGKFLKFKIFRPEKWSTINSGALWFKDSFIIPYERPVGLVNTHRHNVDLQLINY
jgi:hypothetical protein